MSQAPQLNDVLKNITVKPTAVSVPFLNRLDDGSIVTANEVKVSVEGPQVVVPEVRQDGDKLVVSFKATVTGQYKISLGARGQNVQHTPAKVDVQVGNQPAKVADIPEAHTFPVTFEVDAVDADGKPIEGNDFEFEVKGPENPKINASRAGGKLRLQFRTYQSKGQFTIGVKHKGRHIQRSPFDLNLAGLNTSTTEEIARLEPLPTTKEINFKVPGRDAKGGAVKASEVTLQVVSGPENPKSMKVRDVGAELEVTIEVSRPAAYEIGLLKGGQHIEDSPFFVDVPAEAFKN